MVISGVVFFLWQCNARIKYYLLVIIITVIPDLEITSGKCSTFLHQGTKKVS